MADPPTPFAGFITLEQFKAYAGIISTSDDVRLQVIIDAVNLSVDKYIGRTVEKTEYENEIYDGTGTDALILKNFPVTEITEISIYDIVIDERDDTKHFGFGWFTKNLDNGIVYYTNCWPNGRGIIKVSYTAGYDPIPADLTFATLQMALFYRNVGKKSGLSNEWLGSYNVSLMNSLSQMNGELTIPDIAFKMVFDQYRVRDILY